MEVGSTTLHGTFTRLQAIATPRPWFPPLAVITSSGNFTVASQSVFNAASSEITCYGDFTITSPSTFNAGTSTLVLDATNSDINFNAGGYTFHDIVLKSASSDYARTITFGSGGPLKCYR